MSRYDSLLLRIWARDGTDGERWISQVEHVQSGTTLRFKDRDALLAYLAMIVGRHDAGALPADASAGTHADRAGPSPATD